MAPIEINGIAHIQLTVRDVERSTPFYERLLVSMGLKPIMRMEGLFFYCVGSRTGVAISPVDPEFADEPFQQRRVGLHHVCFRARNAADVDAVYEVAQELDARIVHPPQLDEIYAPGYYSVLFEDPDGIRIEVNFVPGKGHLDGKSKGVDVSGFTKDGEKKDKS